MTKVLKVTFFMALTLMLLITTSAKETVIYENDFSNVSLDEFTLSGAWTVTNGELSLRGDGGSAFITYSLDEEYVGKNIRIEVDFLNHTSSGGICIGATGKSLADTPQSFFGYEGFISMDGKKGAFRYYSESGGFGGNLAVGSANIEALDLHLTAEIIGETITYTVTSLDGGEKYFGIEYILGQRTEKLYDAYNNIIGLRKVYSDKGSFDNFKVTLVEEDEMPAMAKKMTFCGVDYGASDAIVAENETISGTGVVFTQEKLAENFKLSFKFTPVATTRFFFGMDDLGNGYAFEVDKENETTSIYRLNKYEYSCLGTKRVPIIDSEYSVTLQMFDGVVSATFDAYFEGEDAFTTFELTLDDYTAGKFGIWLNGGVANEVVFAEPRAIKGERYTNSVVSGADPDVLYYNGTYYLYNTISNSGNARFKVSTSRDLVNWTEKNVVFTHKPDEYITSGYMSPNVFYYNGLFYLFYAAKNAQESSRIYYATSDSPYGPFEHKNGQIPLHDVPEIGGHPYLDESGKVYITFVRFENGNHIWIEEVNIENGLVAPVEGTLTKLISPEFEYEIDGYGAIAEGGVITKHNGIYYMIYASGHYKGHYGESYAYSDNILGPYTKYEYNEILTWNTAINGVGDGIFVQSPDGNELWMVYHKHFSTSQVEKRQTCIDRVKFVKDPKGGIDILTVGGPSTTPQLVPTYNARYDLNEDCSNNLIDVLHLFKHSVSEEYSSKFDLDSNGREDSFDILFLLKEILK